MGGLRRWNEVELIFGGNWGVIFGRNGCRDGRFRGISARLRRISINIRIEEIIVRLRRVIVGLWGVSIRFWNGGS